MSKFASTAKNCLKVRPVQRPAWRGLTAAAIARGDFKAAATHAAQLAKAAPKSYESLVQPRRGLTKKPTAWNRPVKPIRKPSKLQPESEVAYANLGTTLQERGDLPAARKAYERALQIAPGHTGALWNLSHLYENCGYTEDAEKCMEKVVENEPERVDAWFRLGYFRLLRGDFGGSIEPFRNCVSQRSDWLEALVNLGQAPVAIRRSGSGQTFPHASHIVSSAIHGCAARAGGPERRHGDYIQALDAESKLQELGEPMPELAFNIGVLLEKSNLYEDAARTYRRAADEKPGFAEALLNLGHALKALGQEEEARSCWQQAVEAKPELAEKYF